MDRFFFDINRPSLMSQPNAALDSNKPDDFDIKTKFEPVA